jgi:ribonuclease Z
VRSYYYCSDTEYDVSLAPIIHKANLLYHEATFLHDLQDKAVQSMHSTAREAAQLACLAQVQSLLLGHFSSRYMNLDPLLDEARQHFPNAQLAIEGNLYEVPYED